MKTKEQKKQEIADKLSITLRAYNALVPPSQWRGDEEIDAVSSALAYGDGQLDFALQRLMNAAETVQEGNRYTREIRRILKQANAVLYHHHFTYYRMNIICELTNGKRRFG